MTAARDRAPAHSLGGGMTEIGTAIVCPLAAELAGLLAVTAGRRALRVHRRDGRRLKVTLGRLGNEEVALAATGDGPAAAAAGLEALAGALRPRRLLVLGVAGGLTPGLARGTLVAARQVLAGDGGEPPSHPPDERWLAQALRGGAVAGTAISTARILAEPRAKQAALRTLPAVDLAAASAELSASTGGASPAAIPVAIVDLESAAYARVAARLSMPYLVVRSVLDAAEETLPLDFETCRGASGGVSQAHVVLRALAHPGAVADLWRLRSRVKAASARLAALAMLLAGGPARGAVTATAGAATAATAATAAGAATTTGDATTATGGAAAAPGGAAAATGGAAAAPGGAPTTTIGAFPGGAARAPESATAAVAGGRRA